MKQSIIVCLALLFISLQNLYSQTPDIIGTSAPNFEVKDMDGNLISLEESKGKVVVLNFWFTACKHFVAVIPDINEVYEKYKGNPEVVFAAITLSKKKDVNLFLEKYPISYPVVAGARDVCDLFDVEGYPTNIVIDRNGKYFDHLTGESPQIGQYISMSIENALQGK